jgi:hypothetical protein
MTLIARDTVLYDISETMYRPIINRFYSMRTKAERKLELYRLPLSSLLEEFRRVEGIPAAQNPQKLTAALVTQLIQVILEAEFPEER